METKDFAGNADAPIQQELCLMSSLIRPTGATQLYMMLAQIKWGCLLSLGSSNNKATRHGANFKTIFNDDSFSRNNNKISLK